MLRQVGSLSHLRKKPVGAVSMEPIKIPLVAPRQQPIVTADLFDMYYRHVQVCELQFCSYSRIESFYGPCSTLKTFEDHTPC